MEIFDQIDRDLKAAIESEVNLDDWEPNFNFELDLPLFQTDGQVCQLRCMIKDICEQQFYIGFATSGNNVKSLMYNRQIDESYQFMENKFKSRYPFYIVGVPGEGGQQLPEQIFIYGKQDIKINQIVNAVGFVNQNEFHVLQILPETTNFSDDITKEQFYQELVNITGDQQASKLVIACMLSKISQRLSLVGKIAINLWGCDFVNLKEFIQQNYRTVNLSLTVDFLNQNNLIPTKNYDTERMENDLLQIPNETILIIDETQLGEGQLNEQGINNLNMLKILCEQQIIPYDFQFYQINMDVDFPIIIISNSKSILKTGIQAKVQIDNPITTYHSFTNYIKAARQFSPQLTEESRLFAEQKFLNRNPEALGSDEFHLILNVSRSLAKSNLRSEIQPNDISEAFELVTHFS